MTGSTRSDDFPTTSGAFQETINGAPCATKTSCQPDVFVARLNAAGTSFDYSTLLGGAGEDIGYGIVVDATAHAYVTGSTNSSYFPTTSGAFQEAHSGSKDIFVTQLEPDGHERVWSTCWVGSGMTSDARSRWIARAIC